jgi:hypothetical protein
MKIRQGRVARSVDRARALDTSLTRRSNRRGILFDGRTPMNYAIVAPVHAAMRADERVGYYFINSDEPSRAPEVFAEAGAGARVITPLRAAFMRFDAYLTCDIVWATLPRGARRALMSHGVGGKYDYDRPPYSMRHWHRLFFTNERRMRNFIEAGAIDADSPAIRLIGMPKVDCLVNGSFQRDEVLLALGLDPERPTVLYAPTWSPASSLNLVGVELVSQLVRLPVNVLIKLHDRSKELRLQHSGGVNWEARLQPLLPKATGRLVSGSDICPYMAAADVMVTDHSSAAFEYLLLDRPVVRIHVPELLRFARVRPEYVELLCEAALSAHDVRQTIAAIERALENPAERSSSRQRVAADLFYGPGGATARCANALYELMELDPPVALATAPSPVNSAEWVRARVRNLDRAQV